MQCSGIKVAVIGGSITGCTAAIELSRIGCDVTLYERSGEELKERGAGIGVPPSVIEAYVDRQLIGADVPYFNARNFVRRWRTSDEPRFGRLAWEQPTSLVLLNWGMLYRNLRERVPAGVYRTGHRVIGLDLAADHVTLTLAGHGLHAFDLVVCADGYASLGRRTLFPEVDVGYAGYVLWRGVLPEAALAESAPLESGIHALGYPGGHGVFYLVPGPDGSTQRGARLVNWGMYVPVADLAAFMVDREGRPHEGSLPPGAMPHATERELKAAALARLPGFYSDIVAATQGTYVYAIYDCEVPAYRRGRLCLAGDAGAFARPHTGAGALKGVTDAIALSTALTSQPDMETALREWNVTQTEHGNRMVRFGNQLGRALVQEIPDWSAMSASEMERWFTSIVTVDNEVFEANRRRA
ncbi:MAG: FAD-dependent monooxygenase [Gammaproteobacteria bacterium]